MYADYQFWLSLITGSTMIGAFIAASHWGVNTVVIAYAAIVVPLVLSVLVPEAIAARYVLFLIFPIVMALTIVILSPLSLRLGNRAPQRWLWLPTVVMCGALLVLNGSRLPYHYDALDSDYGRTIDFVRANYRAGDDGAAGLQHPVWSVTRVSVYVCPSAAFTRDEVIGNWKRRAPTASEIALAITAPMQTIGGSPAPDAGRSRSSIRIVSIVGSHDERVRKARTALMSALF